MKQSTQFVNSRILPALFVVLAATLAGCGGGGGGGGGITGGATILVGAAIPVTAGNPSDIVNQASAPAVLVNVDLGDGIQSTDVVTVILRDGSGQTASGQSAGLGAPGTLTVGPIDASSLADGALDIVITLSRGSAQYSEAYSSFAKDTVPPLAAIAAEVSAGDSNAVSIVNAFNVGAVDATATLDAAASGADLVFLTFTDGVGSIDAPQLPVVPGGVVSFSLIDLSTLTDGAITGQAKTVDSAGNLTIFPFAVTKDTVIAAPTAGTIPAGGSNPADVVNSNNQSSVSIEVTADAGTLAGDSLALAIVDQFGTTINVPAVAAPAGGGVVAFSALDLSGLADGALGITATNSDAAGNTQTFGFAAVKDTVISVVASVNVVAGANNAVDVINMFNESTIAVQTAFSAATAGEVLTITVSDGNNSVSTQMTLSGGETSAGLGGLNAAGLGQGLLVLTANIADANGNSTEVVNAAVTHDSVAPASATSVAVLGGIVNQANVAAAQIDITVAADSDATRVLVLSVNDGATTVSSSAQSAPTAGGLVSIVLNLAALADGPINLIVDFADGAGNLSQSTGSSTKDTVVSSAQAASVSAGASNAAGVINASNASAVQVAVTAPASADSSESYVVVLSDGVNSATSAPQVPVASATSTHTVNASSLNDGTISVVVQSSDTAGNSAQASFASATKDTVAPDAPTAAAVPAGAQNPADTINANNAASVQVDVQWPATAAASDVVTVTLSDGAATANVLGTVSNPGATVSYLISAAGLADGALSLSVVAVDTAGNQTNFSGTGVQKDTVAPIAPQSIVVGATLANPADFINSASVAGVQVDVDYSNLVATGELISVSLADGVATVSSPTVTANPGAVNSFTLDASTLADGAINVSLTASDTAGNSATYSGTAATKDTTTPSIPTSVTVAAGSFNPVGVVTATSVSAVSVEIVWPAGSIATDQFTVTASDGSSTVVTAAAAVNPGSTQTATMDLSTLADGAILFTVDVVEVSGNTDSTTGSGTKDTSTVVLPTSAAVNTVGAPVNVVNSITVASVQVDVAFPAGARATDTFWVTVSDGGISIATPAASVVPGAVNSVTMDLSILAEGALAVFVSVSDTYGQVTIFNGTSATKDTVAPEAPTSAFVAAGAANAVDTINGSNQASVTVSVSYSATVGSDTYTVELDDNSSTVTSSAQAAVPSGTVNYSGLDATGLADGSITLLVQSTDAAGNPMIFVGAVATKNTTPTASPTSAGVLGVGSTPNDYISAATTGSVTVSVFFPIAATPSDSFTVTLTDLTTPTNTVTSSLQSAASFAAVLVTGIDTSSFGEGPVSVTVTMNPGVSQTTFAGTQAVKDTVAPAALQTVETFFPSEPTFPVNIISNVNVADVGIRLTPPALTGDADDTYEIEIDDGSTVVSTNLGGQDQSQSSYAAFLDASTLASGSVTVRARRIDLAGNASTDTTATAQLSVSVPNTATGLQVINPADTVGDANVGSIDFSFTPGAGEVCDGVIRLTDSNGAFVEGTVASISPSVPVTVLGLMSAVALTDGPLVLEMTLTGTSSFNRAVVTGTVATKSTTIGSPVVDITSAGVDGSPFNNAGYVTLATATAASVTVLFPVGYDPASTCAAKFVDQHGRSSASVAVAPNPGGSTTVSLSASGLSDGALSLVVTTSVTGGTEVNTTAATLDTVPPETATDLYVQAGGSNAQNEINASNATNVVVVVSWPTEAQASDAFTVTFTDSAMGTVTSGVQTVNPGLTQSFTMDASALAVGPVTMTVTALDAAGQSVTYTNASVVRN